MTTRVREGIANFLNNRVADSPFLLSRYSIDLETQVMCDTDGEPGDRSGTYTDGEQTWGNKRWPAQAGTDPKLYDPELTFSPADHVERVGTTWWNFATKKSVAVGIDIDAAEGHAEGTTTNEEAEIDEIVGRLKSLDYVTVVRSTGGKGLHVYVFFNEDTQPDARNHHEHTVVARKTLKLISDDIGYDLRSHVDCVGSVFWIWAAKSPADHPGFSVVKEGTLLDGTRLAGIELPSPHVKGKNATDFEVTELDADHKRILEAISAQPYYFNMRHDMNLVHTHTCAIRDAIDQGLEIRGEFETSSNGSDPGTANCFMAPQPGGVFRVYRFGQSQHEPSWTFANGKNWCYLNDEAAPEEIVSRHAEKYQAGKYLLTPAGAKELAASLGEPFSGSVPDDVWAVINKGLVEFRSKKGADGWKKSGNIHSVTVTPKQKGNLRDRLLRQCDETIRFVTQGGNPRGWYHKLDNGDWLEHKNYNELACIVKERFGEFADRAHSMMMQNPWDLVRLPFQPEYPGQRCWNRDAPQLKVEPADSGGEHPHFDMILEHVGHDLDEAVQTSDWCRKANILSGADYLRTWLACLIHHTDQPLPYIFLAGPQNSGKSIVHEACKFLFTGGITSANSALTSQFNAELSGCFLVYIEERDLADKRYNAYEKIKEWVTGRELLVTEKYATPTTVPNFLHFIQMANNTSHLPLEDGDTRIVAIDVPALKNPVPKAIMEQELRKEAPRFLRTLLNTVVPDPIDRLRIPALRTRTKELMERKAMSPVMAFRKEAVYDCPGHKIEFSKFIDAYAAFCESNGLQADPEFLVIQEVTLRSDRFTVGIRNRKQYILNVSLDPKAKPKDKSIEPNNDGRF
jgi:hypothetical protein